MHQTHRGFLIFCSLLIATVSISQDAGIRKLQAESSRTIAKNIRDSLKSWHTGGIYNISIGQGSLSNWAAGGDEFSFSVATSVNLYAFYQRKKTSWDNMLNANFGYINTTSLGGRKNDDRLDIVSKYGYALHSRLNLTTLMNFRTQLMNGYSYTETTKGNFAKNFSSAFLSPAYVLVSQGLDYKPGAGLSVFVSPVTSRWVIVMDDTLAMRGDYGVEPGKNSSNQLGAFATVNYSTKFNKFISYTGRLDLFSNYRKEPLNTDVYMTNTVSAKLGKVVCLSWNLDMIYDDDVELFGVGLQVKI
jgi:hypothetical protein